MTVAARRRDHVGARGGDARPTEADPGVVERIVELGDAGSVQLTVAPAQAGFNQIHLYLFDPDGRPAEIARVGHAGDEPAVG